jgi:membrane protein DedA with SNARE-associated domain
MELFFSQSLDVIKAWDTRIIYLFLFASAIMENLFPPIPGDTITAFGAFLVGMGRLDFFMVLVVTTLGSSVGFIILFYVGAFLEREFFIHTDIKFFSAKSILAAEKWFARYGYYVVAINRFLPGVRSVISIAAGISGLSGPKVFILSLVSAVFWNFLWIYSGYTLGNNWEFVQAKFSLIIRSYNIAAVIILILVCMVYIGMKFFRKKIDLMND